jgi:hypothetical protein
MKMVKKKSFEIIFNDRQNWKTISMVSNGQVQFEKMAFIDKTKLSIYKIIQFWDPIVTKIIDEMVNIEN